MSLYNVIFGENEMGRALVDLLTSVQPLKVGRYRDAWIEHDGDALMIRVHTRNGGNNRAAYDDPSMHAHPWYVRDEDDDLDATYADYWFRVDLEWLAKDNPDLAAAMVHAAQAPVDMGARWQAAIGAMANTEGR